MKWDDILRKVTRTKLWAAVGGGGSGLVVVDQGVDLVSTSETVGILTILGGVLLTAASVVAYLAVEGNIDKAREEVKGMLTGGLSEDWEED